VPTRIPTVAIQELYVSVGAGADPTGDARAYDALVANKPVVPLDENIARRAGVPEGEHLTSDSKPTLGPGDAVVAATGLVHNEPVVTNDTDFETVDGLPVELY
jgi:tRNA(fMet)-specific endonuclease VapC